MNLIYLIFSGGGQGNNQKATNKVRQKASKSRAGRGVFYVAMIQQIISELARLFDTERCSFLMVYPFVVDGFLSQKAQKGAKSRAGRGYYFIVAG